MTGTTTSSLLPAGYLSTSGGQTVDANGDVVRLQSIAWFGSEGPAGTTLNGLPNNVPGDPATQTAIQNWLSQIASEGFNTVRIPWSDVNLQSALPLFKQVVAEAGNLGLRVIFDHHDNDGHWGQQVNGLWFDTGAGSDGTDGANTTGTISAAQFQADTVTLASAFKGNSTVIGFDLDNEPLVTGSNGVNWGQGGPTDILAMYNAVGSAVEAADPGALIIAEGPQNWNGTLLNGRAGLATEGDLSEAGAKPIALTVSGQSITDKVLYSVHEYPSTIGGEPTDSGSSYIQQMNAAWGYLESGNIAPVWIGEMGGSFDNGGGTDTNSSDQLANELAWASTIVPYLNGQDGSQGGPTVVTSYDWWTSGNFPGGAPDGYNSGAGGSLNSGQQAVVSQLLTYQRPAMIINPSANDTTVNLGSSAAITDTGGNLWTITASGQVAVNGTADTTTAHVIELAYVNGTVWQENASDLWWGKTNPTASWSPGAGTATSPLPVVVPSANDTTVNLGSSAAITDTGGNLWTITASGQVAVNGTADTTTAHVIELAYVNGTVWQENASDLWWGKTSPTAPWSPGAGTAISPLLGAITIAATQATVTISQSKVFVSATLGNHMLFMSGSDDTVSLSGGTNTITDTGSRNTYVIPVAGKGFDTFTNNVLHTSDMLDLRTALAGTNWNGAPTMLFNYFAVTSFSQSATLLISSTSGGIGVAIAAIGAASGTTLRNLLAHAVT